MRAKDEAERPTPAEQLRALVEKFPAKDQKLFRALRTSMRKRFPTANELAYDYGNSVVLSYAPNERGIDAVVAIALRPDDVRLYFNQSAVLPDPKKLLLGTGKQARYGPIAAASDVAKADVKKLLDAALAAAPIPLPAEGAGVLMIKSDGAKRKARKRAKK
ncbi:MAG: hypothetical protein R3F34_19255 [Planctomycetota bacterium]